MAKWPKDSPGTWYSHYKRGSLVSGPACSPGWGLDFVCLMLCMVLVLPYKVCICIDAFLLLNYCGAWFSMRGTHHSVQQHFGDALSRKWKRGLGTIQARFAKHYVIEFQNLFFFLNSWLYFLPATPLQHLQSISSEWLYVLTLHCIN